MDGDISSRYKRKINDFCDGLDPYKLETKRCKEALPANVGYFDVANYLIKRESSYSKEAFRAYRSLEAYKFYQSGWIQEISCRKITNGSIVIGKVKHSQRLNEKPLIPWVVVDQHGIILTAHCSCMAGLGESCLHIGAVLFLLEEWARKRPELGIEDVSCTDILSKWLIPPMKNIQMKTVKQIGWKKTINISADILEPLSGSEIDGLLRSMQSSGATCALMAVREPFCRNFIPQQTELRQNLPPLHRRRNSNLYLQNLYHDQFAGKTLSELVDTGRSIIFRITDADIDHVKSITLSQAKCAEWYLLRAGRVTASNFKAACRTSVKSPAVSLIKKICYPEKEIFNSKATRYGKQNERVARDSYVEAKSKIHLNFKVEDCGLLLSKQYPYIGASPDGIATCDCCGKVVLEIKCPYNLKDNNFKNYFKRRDCPIECRGGIYFLVEEHSYYYQVQLQMYLAQTDCCDFVIYYPAQTIIIRTTLDNNFVQRGIAKCKALFDNVILPQLFGRYFTELRTPGTTKICDKKLQYRGETPLADSTNLYST